MVAYILFYNNKIVAILIIISIPSLYDVKEELIVKKKKNSTLIRR